mmetsp:Transcript_1855/g.6589  ORF Transcript_1855/g.6589 Transcript_1855/m.6589 type:complete len:101 (-) Transcript_1855:664-966(-)
MIVTQPHVLRITGIWVLECPLWCWEGSVLTECLMWCGGMPRQSDWAIRIEFCMRSVPVIFWGLLSARSALSSLIQKGHLEVLEFVSLSKMTMNTFPISIS